MAEKLLVGRTWEVEWPVTAERCAHAYGNAGVYVFGTPALVTMMEVTAADCVRPCLEDGQVTLGTRVEVLHLAATPLGMKVRCRATLRTIEGRRLGYELEAWDEKELIARGTQERAIVHLERFLQRTARKKSGAA